MKQANIFHPVNHLARSIKFDDGPLVTELIADAERRVEAQGEAIRDFVAEMMQEIVRFANEEEQVLLARAGDLRDVASKITEVAGAANLTTVGEVAQGIVAIISTMQDGGPWRPDALRLHFGSFGVLRDTGVNSEEAKLIIEKLRAMRNALKIVE